MVRPRPAHRTRAGGRPGRRLNAGPNLSCSLRNGPATRVGLQLRLRLVPHDETKHPRGQPDNAGKFRRKPIPAPPPVVRRSASVASADRDHTESCDRAEPYCADVHTIDPTTEVCYRCGTPLATIRTNEDENWYWSLEGFEGTPFERFDAVSRALCDADKRIADPTLERCRECSHYWFCFTEQGRKWKDGTTRDSEDMRKAEFAVNNLSRILG